MHTQPDLAARRQAVLADPSRRGLELGRAYTELVDGWLANLLGNEADVAVVAVGGYGRGQLFPASDLDVVLVHRGRRDIAAVAERLWYPVWDARVALDHSVRTVKEALAVARSDVKAAMGLLDARLVAGDGELAAELATAARRQWRDGARTALATLDRLTQERHEREGEVAFLLEPNLKEGRGGLRDVTGLLAAALAAPVLGGGDLVLGPAAEVLARARTELHRVSGRASDRLLLQEQDGVAAALDLADADALMAGVAGAARTVAWASDDAWRRIRSWQAGPRGRVAERDRPLGPGIVLRDGEVEIGGAARSSALVGPGPPQPGPAGVDPSQSGPAGVDPSLSGPAGVDPSLLLRAAEAAAWAGTRLSRSALAFLAERAPPLTGPWPEDARMALVSLLGAGRPAIAVLEDLDQHGLLVRVLPEWEWVRNRPQRNAYHRFTVDRHLLEAAAEAADRVRRVARPDLLLVGAWLHDLGKGWPGDHTEAGIALLEEIGPRLGFDAGDVAILLNLVRHHLLLADTATRRDLTDPSTIQAVADAVGDRPTLDLLAALTESDARATGDWAWTGWKQGLVADLVQRVGLALEGQPPPPLPTFPQDRHCPLIQQAAGGWLVDGLGERVTVVAPDRPGVFSLVTGVLALEGLNVLAADAWSGDGVAVSEHRVSPELGGEPDWRGFNQRLVEMARHPDALDGALARRARDYGRRRRPRAGREPDPRVLVDLDASDSATVVEVWAPDQMGLLHRVTSVFACLGLDIRHAKVQTIGHDVVDTFYLRDQAGDRVTDTGVLAQMQREVLASLRSAPAHPA